MTRQTFKNTTVLKLEVEQTPTGLVNLVANPPSSEVLSNWGWIDGATGTTGVHIAANQSGFSWILLNPQLSVPGWYATEDFAVAAGQYLAARWAHAGPSGNNQWLRARFEWIDSTGAVFASSTQTAYLQAANGTAGGGTVESLAAVQAPVGTVRARLRYDLYANNAGGNPTNGQYVREVTVAKAATAAALTGLGYLPGATYTDVLGSSHTISVKRDALNVGTLTAEILNATIDPSASTLIRPGKRCRLMALDNATSTWTPIFTGRVLRANTEYDPKITSSKRARITLTATDAVAQLASVKRSNGVAAMAYMYYVMQGVGVPYVINAGPGGILVPAVYVTANADATALDQVAITRDSVRGLAFVDRWNVLRLVDVIGGAAVATLNESVYSGFDLDYDTDRCINVVTVKLRRINAATGQTVEVTYGPYVDQASVDQWGPHAAEFTVQGITDTDAAAAAYAAPILTANATPAVRINAVQIPIRDATDIVTTKALLDLYDLVTVANTSAGISTNMRITGIEHRIDDGKWMLNLDFTVEGSVAPPQVTPQLPAPVVADTGWTALPYAASWTDTGSGWQAAQYRKDGSQLYLRGLPLRQTTASGANSVIATLPVGFRPLATQPISESAIAAGGGAVGANAVYINSSGQIITSLSVAANGSVPLNAVIYLD